MGTFYRPRVLCRLQLPVVSANRDAAIQAAGNGDVISMWLRVRRVAIEYNDHNQADTATVTADWRDVGIDPRLVKSATVEIYIGNSDDNGDFSASVANLRFIGVMNRPRRAAKEGSPMEVELEFRDYTAFFLNPKSFPSAGLPSFKDSIQDAWQKICDHVGPLDDDGNVLSSVAALRNRLEASPGVDLDRPIGAAVAPRFARQGKVLAKPEWDAWAVWQQCVGMCGLISYIDRDKCIVATATDHFTPTTAPAMLWGNNILEMDDAGETHFSDKGVAAISVDLLTGTMLEAFYPPANDPRIRRKRESSAKSTGVHAHRIRAKAPAFESERYDYFEYPSVTDPNVLFEIAKRAWAERARQELQGRLKTCDMFADASDNSGSIDLLNLRAGDSIQVKVDQYDNAKLKSLGSDSARFQYLEERGYSDKISSFIVKNMSALDSLLPTYHTKQVRIELEASEDAGKFEVDIQYHNLINIDV